MSKETRNDVPVHTQVVHEMGTAVIVYSTIGNIENCQVASFLKTLRRHMIGLLRTSLMSGARSWERSNFI
jgi:hypothetical protein